MFEKVNYNDCGNMGIVGWISQVICVLLGVRLIFIKQSLSGCCDGVDFFCCIFVQGVSKVFMFQQELMEWKIVLLC